MVFAWKIVKKAGVVLHKDGSEIRTFFTGTKRNKVFRRFFESRRRIIKYPTPSYEDNSAVIQHI